MEGFSLSSSARSFSYLSRCHSSPEEEEGAEHVELAALWGQLSLSTFMVVLTVNFGHRAFAGFPEPSHWPPVYPWWKVVYLCVCKCLPTCKYVYHVPASCLWRPEEGKSPWIIASNALNPHMSAEIQTQVLCNSGVCSYPLILSQCVVFFF